MNNQDKTKSTLTDLQTQTVWTTHSIARHIHGAPTKARLKATERMIQKSDLCFTTLNDAALRDEHDRPAKRLVLKQLIENARKKRKLVLFAQLLVKNGKQKGLALNDARGGRRWILFERIDVDTLECAVTSLSNFEGKAIVIIPSGKIVDSLRLLVKRHHSQQLKVATGNSITIALGIYSHGHAEILETAQRSHTPESRINFSHLDRLEAESIHIMREVMAEAENPVMLYSIGKDSSVMVHLARKAFFPSPPPFPLLHVDTRWKFQAMYDFRDYVARESEMKLLVHINPEGVSKNINPIDHGSALHTDIMKTQSLKMALENNKFDVAFGGARRDEEKSRAKERIFSFRTSAHGWDPKNQRPELWNLYNGKKNKDETIRVFPISNWTELDIWLYIYREKIPIVPLYFAAERPVVERNGMLLLVDDDRLTVRQDETIQMKKIRFRTLGCYPLTGAIESDADDVASVVLELLEAKTSERQGRAIDTDSSSSMETKKREGYF